MNNSPVVTLIAEKQARLEEVKAKLKGDFVGLDAIIDQVIESIKIWYIFPELQIRPTIVCLWGMTGVGKTDLVRKMVSYLKLQEKFLEIEMDGNTSAQDKIQSKMERSSLSPEDPAILFLDEFQKFRTVNNTGDTNDAQQNYRDVWTLLSDGRFQADLSRKTEIFEHLLCSKYYSDWEENTVQPEKIQERRASKDKITYKTPVYTAQRLKRLFRLEDAVEDIMKYDDARILELYNQFANSPKTFEGDCYKKLLIIISGNLDEAYHMADDVSESDLDADFYHEFSKRISILQIKHALTQRFRPEQIARLGNTHILYPSLSKDNYRKIIEKKCQEIARLIFDTKGITLSYDASIYDTIYKNGVFPTQGVRPLLSTLTNILSSGIPLFLYQCLMEGQTTLTIGSRGNKMIGTVGEKSLEVEIPTVLESLRRGADADVKHVVAVHEMGHALAYALLFNISPAQICIDAGGIDGNGFVIPHNMVLNKDTVIKQLTLRLAGMAAEEIVFGELAISTGSWKDRVEATNSAFGYVTRWGYNGYVSTVTMRTDNNDGLMYDCEGVSKMVETLMKNAKTNAVKLLTDHLPLYKALLATVLKTVKMSPEEFVAICSQHGYDISLLRTGEKMLHNYKSLTDTFLKA